MAKQVNNERLLEMIRLAIQVTGSQKGFAREAGISQQYLCDVLRGRREIGQKILDWFGLEKVVAYRRVDGGQL